MTLKSHEHRQPASADTFRAPTQLIEVPHGTKSCTARSKILPFDLRKPRVHPYLSRRWGDWYTDRHAKWYPGWRPALRPSARQDATRFTFPFTTLFTLARKSTVSRDTP